MVIGTLKNIEFYKNLSPDINLGLQFIANTKAKIELGVYPINKNTKAIVSSYSTVYEFERGYEAHKNVIDIQYPVIGTERVKWSPIENMDISIPYDEENDTTFYKNPSKQCTHIDIGNGVFAIMFPEDGHSPQHFVKKSEIIKKITVKIKIK